MQYSFPLKGPVRRIHPVRERWLLLRYTVYYEWLPRFKKSTLTRILFSIGYIALLGLIGYSAFGYVHDANVVKSSLSERPVSSAQVLQHVNPMRYSNGAQRYGAFPRNMDETLTAQPDATLKSLPLFVPLYFFGLGFFLVMKCGWIRTQGHVKNDTSE